MIAGHRQAAPLNDFTLGLQGDIKIRNPGFVAKVYRAHIGLNIKAKGDDAPIGDLANQRLNLGVIGVAHR